MRVCLASGCSADYDIVAQSLFRLGDTVDGGKILGSGENLSEIISMDRTEVLIVDATLPGVNLVNSIQKIREQKFLQVILIIPEKSYFYAYMAMKLQACELLIRPIDIEQISSALVCASDHLKTEHFFAKRQREISRRSFAEQISVILDGQKTTKDINEIYNTTFQNGLYRVVTFSVDFPNIGQIPKLAEQLCAPLLHFLEEKLTHQVFDIIFTRVYNEIRFLLNYPETNEDTIVSTLPELLLLAENLCTSSPSLEVFMGVGNSYNDINKLPQSSDESRNGIWQRLSRNSPSNKISYHSMYNCTLPDQYNQTIYTLDQHIKASMENLNSDMFKKYVNDLFSLPKTILCLPEVQVSILNQIRYFCNLYKDKINLFDDANTYYYRTKMQLLSSRSFRELQIKYIKNFTVMFQRFLSASESTFHKGINQAISYIDSHYNENLSLEAISSKAELNPSYFSRRFKAETGQTFTAYILNKRLSVAKTLLQKTNYRINEISAAVGYPDQRYFSSIFSKHVGMSPSMYRKIKRS